MHLKFNYTHTHTHISGRWWTGKPGAAVHGVSKSCILLNNWTTIHTHTHTHTHTHMHTPQEECKELMKSDPLEHGRKGQSFSVGKKIQEIRIESEILTEKCI